MTPNPRPRRAAIYARISQDRTGAGLGVERQEQDCRELATRNGWTVVEVYTDNDTSAYSGKPRPGYRRMLAAIESGHVDAVITWHTDRLQRDIRDMEDYIDVVGPRKVPTATVRAGDFDLNTAFGKRVARQAAVSARGDSDEKSEKLRRQREQLRERGLPHGGRRPFGYEVGGMVLVPSEALLVADATRRVVAGASVRSIFREWNAAGVTTTAGKAWDGSNLRAMLLRPRNAGLMAHGGHIVGDAAWPPLVDRDTWDALGYVLKDPARRTHSGTSRRLVGSFLYLCECGRRVTSGGNLPAGGPRYACPDGHLRRAAADIDTLTMSAVAGYLVAQGVTLVTPTVDAAPWREQLAALRVRSDELAALVGEGAMTPAQFRTASGRVGAQIAEAERELASLTAGSILSGIADAPDPGAAFLSADVDRQREVIDAVCTVTLLRTKPGRVRGGGYFDPESVLITWRSASST